MNEKKSKKILDVVRGLNNYFRFLLLALFLKKRKKKLSHTQIYAAYIRKCREEKLIYDNQVDYMQISFSFAKLVKIKDEEMKEDFLSVNY